MSLGKKSSAVSSDGDIRGSRGSLTRLMRDMDPHKGYYNKLCTTHHRMLLRILGAWCKSPNNRLLSYKDAFQETGCKNMEATVRTWRFLWSETLLRIGDHRLAKRVMLGELKNAGTREPAGKKNGRTSWQWMVECLVSQGPR